LKNKNIRIVVLYSLSALLLLVFAVDQIFVVMEHPEWFGWGIFFGVSSLIIFAGIVYGLIIRKESNEK